MWCSSVTESYIQNMGGKKLKVISALKLPPNEVCFWIHSFVYLSVGMFGITSTIICVEDVAKGRFDYILGNIRLIYWIQKHPKCLESYFQCISN